MRKKRNGRQKNCFEVVSVHATLAKLSSFLSPVKADGLASIYLDSLTYIIFQESLFFFPLGCMHSCQLGIDDSGN